MENKTCQNCKKDFTIEPDDFSFYEKMKVPPPTFCPECRLIRRLARRNERSFYRRKCEKCQKNGISVFPVESGIHIYCSACWASDGWEAMDYKADFDSTQIFITQLNNLFLTVPLMALYGLYTSNVNSEYSNMTSYLKNCYMVTYSDYGENLIYGSFVNYCKDSIDNLMGKQLELCYETINCNECYRIFFSVDCTSCADMWFSKNCVGCNDCFGCVNLKQKSYYIFNEPYSREEYQEKIKELLPTSLSKLSYAKRKAEAFCMQFPQKYFHGIRIINSSGDYLVDTKNVKDSFIGFNFEDCRFCSFVTGKLTDTYDFLNYGEDSSLIYETIQAGDQSTNIKMCHWAMTHSQNLEYCLFCITCKDCFGCVGLKKKQYCILNKQYTKEEYFKKRQEIIDQMNTVPFKDSVGLEYKYGEFLPIEISPFAYNETTAQEFFPLKKEEAISKGYTWRDPEKRNYQPTIKAIDLPENIAEVTDEICNEIVECEHEGNCEEQCTQAFKIIPEELAFYRRIILPLPRLCPNCRHHKRIQYRNPMRLWHRSCMCTLSHHDHEDKCSNEFETSYAPNRPEIVYCERCYQQEVN